MAIWASTAGAICSGRLCSSGGSGWMSTAQPCRSQIMEMSTLSAPHAMIATRSPSDGEGELIDESVVEVGAIGQFQVLDLADQGSRTMPLRP